MEGKSSTDAKALKEKIVDTKRQRASKIAHLLA
jgi:hypothetical protein